MAKAPMKTLSAAIVRAVDRGASRARSAEIALQAFGYNLEPWANVFVLRMCAVRRAWHKCEEVKQAMQ
eukprot:11558038-Alexandrium_andersonii.AAC.1